MANLNQQVLASMENEVKHGRLFFGFTEADIAADILQRDSTLHYTVDQIMPTVKYWCWALCAERAEELISLNDVDGALEYLSMWLPDPKDYIITLLKPESQLLIAGAK